MKRILSLVLALCLALTLCACGGSAKNAEDPAAAQPVVNLKDYEGFYTEEFAHRGQMTVTAMPEGTLAFVIDWPDSAFSRSHIEMTGYYDAEQALFVYSDGVWIVKNFDEQGKETDEVRYTRGSGTFQPVQGKLIWTDASDPGREPSSFVYESSLAEHQNQQSEIIIPAPSIVPAATPTPTVPPAPTASPSPSPSTLPVVTKHPTDETVKEGGSCMFVAWYENAIWAVWHFLSPDGQTDLTYEAAAKQFPTLEILNGMYSSMTLRNVPAELNGWRVYCRYSNDAGFTNTRTALITVTAAPKPSVTPTPGPTAAPDPSSPPVINEWVDTTDLNEAVTQSGVSFTPPLAQVIPGELHFLTYRYKTGIIEAAYAGDGGSIRLRVRKSYNLSGTALSGDYNQYSQAWELTLKGVTLQCEGDGETANVAYFTNWYDNFSINYNPGREGFGLTPDQLNSFLNCIQ